MVETPSNNFQFPGFTPEEISEFDFEFCKDFKVELGMKKLETENGSINIKQWLIFDKEAMKQFRKFVWWRDKKLPANEFEAGKFAAQMSFYITKHGGKFLRDELGGYHILLNDRRIPIDATSDDMKAFMLDTCKITSVSVTAEMAVERLRIAAYRAASKMVFRRFSAMYDAERVYVPVAVPGKIMLITSKEVSLVPNGDNADQVWLEHPEQNPFKPMSGVGVRTALGEFQRLIVESQACEVPEMRWFVGMTEAVFPLVRDVASNRFIMVHKGSKGHGKTTGAKSAVLLHGFEDVFMDASVASLGNIPEQGLVVLDNKESANFTQPLIDYCLSIATGGKRLRCVDGGVAVRRNAPRPVTVITSIDGVQKAELHDRCIDVKYFLGGTQARLKRGALEREIVDGRDAILSALTVVVQEYLTVRRDPAAQRIAGAVNPIDRFSEHFEEVCYLLIAYGRVMYGADGDAWSADIIHVWDTVIRENRGADAPDQPVSALEAPVLAAVTDGHIPQPYTWQGTAGNLYIVFPGDILLTLQRNPALLRDLPKEGGGLVERLKSEHIERFVLLTSRTLGPDGKPLGTKGTGVLRRRESGQPVGVFVPNDTPPSPASDDTVASVPDPTPEEVGEVLRDFADADLNDVDLDEPLTPYERGGSLWEPPADNLQD